MRAPHRANHAFSTVIYLRPFRPCSFIASFSPFFNVGPASPGAIDILAINKDPTDSPISLIRANNRKESRSFRFATIDGFFTFREISFLRRWSHYSKSQDSQRWIRGEKISYRPSSIRENFDKLCSFLI